MVAYQPRIDPELWAKLRPFVDSLVQPGAVSTGYSDRELYAVVTPLAVWMETRAGLLLEIDIALAPNTIDQFVMEGLSHYTNAGRGTMRSRLRRLSEALVPELEERARERALGKSKRVAPYSRDDIVEFRAWARALPDRVRGNAERLLALGFGAGLQGSEIGNLRPQEITVDEGVVVHVHGQRDR
ncbi:hypothetical protein, partial [Kitasatospora herbaricolor]|uniref:hypothetical protein n=1 Tax=Kitasatospora herbaricolor TaxID=68217 RepID=UPI0036DC62BB